MKKVVQLRWMIERPVRLHSGKNGNEITLNRQGKCIAWLRYLILSHNQIWPRPNTNFDFFSKSTSMLPKIGPGLVRGREFSENEVTLDLWNP